MKNLFVLPTDKPSRLYLGNNGNFVFGMIQTSIQSKNDDFTNQNIYITNDEKIKEGDYVCASGGFRFVKTLNNDKGRTFKDDGIVSKQNPSSSCHLSNYKKIILTTDQDLINDGVQAIDDEFLEWFVKNPSCEEVEVDKNWNYPLDKSWEYKIIIPKEEPKQETTLEEAAVINYKKLYEGEPLTQDVPIDAFIDGAKWQQERSYSEEEVKNIVDETIEKFYKHFYTLTKAEMKKQWFEQFKKK